MNFDGKKSCAVRCALVCGVSAMAMAGAIAQVVPGVPAALEPNLPSMAAQVKALKAASAHGSALEPNSLGSFSSDTVYTSVTPCRIVDTRVAGAGGALRANVTRTFDVDGATFTAQGGSNASCGIPYGVVSAVAMTIHAVTPPASGSMFAWGLGSKPGATVINYTNGQTVANTTIVPVVPGAGDDFSINAQNAMNVVIDVVGYFAAPVATALDCISVASAVTSIPYNAYTAVDAICPVGRTATGGGTFPIEGTLGRSNIWTDGSPTVANGWRTWVDNQTGSARSVQGYAVCCRIPGR